MVSFVALQQLRLQIKHRRVNGCGQIFLRVEHHELAGFFQQKNLVSVRTLRAQIARRVERLALPHRQRQHAVGVDRFEFIEQHRDDGTINVDKCRAFLSRHFGAVQCLDVMRHHVGGLKCFRER